MIENFTGVSACYEEPIHPDVHLDGKKPVSELVYQLLDIIVPKIFIKI